MPGVDLQHLVPEHIRRFEAYVPSKPDPELMKLFGCARLLRLNNNENPLGPAPAAQAVIRGFRPPRAALYPSGDCFYLCSALAERLGVEPRQVLVGNGANEVIAFVIKAFCQEGDNIITADKTFAVYEWVAEFSGLAARLVPLKDLTFDDQGMLAAIDARTKILFVCNPNNPTGTYWSEARLRRFLDAVGGRQIVVVDEAYCEFVEAPDFPDAVRLCREYPNLVSFRTFSKMHALAGLRIGYLVGAPEVVDVVRRTCVVYSVNTVAQEAALAALEDPTHAQRTRELMRAERAYLGDALEGMGLPVVRGTANYMMVKLPLSDTLAYRKLMAQGVMVRAMTGFRFPNWIRISLAAHEAMTTCVTALEQLLDNHRSPRGT